MSAWIVLWIEAAWLPALPKRPFPVGQDVNERLASSFEGSRLLAPQRAAPAGMLPQPGLVIDAHIGFV